VGQRSLADLARIEQSHGRHMAQAVPDQSFDSARYHPCNYGILRQICKDDVGATGSARPHFRRHLLRRYTSGIRAM
jgi:hypothetical protein